MIITQEQKDEIGYLHKEAEKAIEMPLFDTDAIRTSKPLALIIRALRYIPDLLSALESAKRDEMMDIPNELFEIRQRCAASPPESYGFTGEDVAVVLSALNAETTKYSRLKRALDLEIQRYYRLKLTTLDGECCVVCANYMTKCQRGVMSCEKFEYNCAKFDYGVD
jgi:hypothetical protein